MKKICCLFFLLILFNQAPAQVSLIKNFSSSDTLNDYAFSALPTSDGGSLIAGTSFDSVLIYSHGFLLKLDSNTNIQWSKEYFQGLGTRFWAVDTTPDHGYLLAGGIMTSFIHPYGCFVVKTDSSGNVQWSKIYQGDQIVSLSRTFDNGYVFTGTTGRTFPGGGYSVTSILRIDSVGNVVWHNSYGGTPLFPDAALCVKETLDHGAIVTGFTTGFNSTSIAMYMLKVDSLGHFDWAQLLDSTEGEVGFDIAVMPDSGFVVVGRATDSLKSNGAAMIRTDKNGHAIWGTRYSTQLGDYSEFQKVILTPDNGFLMQGKYSNTHTTLVKTDSLGQLEWFHQFDSVPQVPSFNPASLWRSGVSQTTFVAGQRLHYSSMCIVKSDDSLFSCSFNRTDFFNVPYFPILRPISFDEVPLFDSDTVLTTSGNYIFHDSLICGTPLSIIENYQTANTPFIKVFPNPSSNLLCITTNSQQPISIYNLYGQLILENIPPSHNPNAPAQINISNFSPGIYLLKSGNHTTKFIKQ